MALESERPGSAGSSYNRFTQADPPERVGRPHVVQAAETPRFGHLGSVTILGTKYPALVRPWPPRQTKPVEQAGHAGSVTAKGSAPPPVVRPPQNRSVTVRDIDRPPPGSVFVRMSGGHASSQRPPFRMATPLAVAPKDTLGRVTYRSNAPEPRPKPPFSIVVTPGESFNPPPALLPGETPHGQQT